MSTSGDAQESESHWVKPKCCCLVMLCKMCHVPFAENSGICYVENKKILSF
jgi:hypothetical protein